MNDFFYDLDNLDVSWGSAGFFNPKNLTEEQIKQLQEHLGITADGKFGPQTTRALQEKLGVKADGKWGNVSSNAWNDAYWNEVEERNKHNRAKAAGVENPYVENVENVVDYVPQYAENISARKEKIAQLEQQIAQVKERIVRNERALAGKSYEDVNNKLAALEMKKINSQDPTMIWRWQQQRQDTMNANAAQDAKTSAAWNKDANYVMSAEYDNSNDASMVMAQNNIRKVIEEGRLLGKTDEELSPLYNKLNSIQTERNDLSVTTKKESVIKDIQNTISEGAIDTAYKDIDDALNNGIINERDAEKLLLRLNEKRYEKENQRQQREDNNYDRRRKRKADKEADDKKSDEAYIGGLLGGK